MRTVDSSVLEALSPEERIEAEEKLREVRQAMERNPLWAYEPYPKQQQFHESEHRIRMFVGGNRAGKSTTGAVDDLIQVLPPEFVPPDLQLFKKYGWQGPAKVRVITPDLGHTMQVVINKFRELTPRAAIEGGEWRRAFDKTRRVLSFKNGSVIDFMSTEQDPDKFGGVDLHRVHYDEEPSGPNADQIWQESRWRLLDHKGDLLLTMTPLFGYSLVYDRVWQRRNQPDVFAIQASVWDNPHIDKAEIEAATQDMSEEEKRARVHGEFVHFSGLFYDEFKERDHVVNSAKASNVREQSIVVGIDPGYRHPGAVWVAFDNDNVGIVFAEVYKENLIVADHAQLIKEMNAKWGIDPDYYVIDPSARNLDAKTGQNIEDAYQRAGIPVIPGQAQRGPGILEVKRRLQQEGLFVSRDCERLIWEFGYYRRDPKSDDEFKAIKEKDHLLDALRYVCMARPWAESSVASEEFEMWTPGTAASADWLERAPSGNSPPLGAMT